MAGASRKNPNVTEKRRRHRRQRAGVIFLTVFVCVTVLGLLTLGGIVLLNGTTIPAYAETERESMEEHASEPAGGILTRIEGDTGQYYEAEMAAREAAKEEEGRYGAILKDAAAMQEIHAVEVLAENPERVTVTFAGDILFDDSYSPMVRLKQRGGDIAECFSAELLAEMDAANVFMLNNEFTYTDRGMPTEGKQYTFRAKPSHVSYLKDLSVDVVSLANNHAFDYGEISLTDTLDTLTEAGIPYVGAGRNLEEASRPLMLMTKGLKIAVVSATQIERQDHPNTRGATEDAPGVFRCWNPQKLYETVEQAKTESDFVVVYIHWGTENTTELDWAQREQVKGLAEAGADLIIGDHPHCLQEVGYVDGVPVIYSLGNFWFNSRALDTCMVKAVITPDGLESLQFLPARQENCYTSLLMGGEAERVIAYMNTLSNTAIIEKDGSIRPK